MTTFSLHFCWKKIDFESRLKKPTSKTRKANPLVNQTNESKIIKVHLKYDEDPEDDSRTTLFRMQLVLKEDKRRMRMTRGGIEQMLLFKDEKIRYLFGIKIGRVKK